MQQRPEVVFAIGREVVHHGDAAACSERRPFDMAYLRSGTGELVDIRGGFRFRISQSVAADLESSAHIAFHQGCRKLLRLSAVIESLIAETVLRQELGHILFDSKQVTHRVRVFVTRHPLKRPASRIRMKSRGPVHCRFE